MTVRTIAFTSCAAVALAGVLMRAQAPAYPPRAPVAKEILDRGKALYGVHCAFCHGADARGGDGGGPNLLRSQLVLSDQKGELIGEVVTNGRPNTPMLPIRLAPEQMADVAAYIHSFPVGGYDITRQPPASILVGDARAGETAFRSRCSSCHSTTGDLNSIGTRIPDARDLQTRWLMPPAAGRITATVTLSSGQKVEGRLVRIDDFLVAIQQADGMPRSFGRTGDVPKVEINDPLKPHRDLLGKYTDKEIHDITAYLATVK